MDQSKPSWWMELWGFKVDSGDPPCKVGLIILFLQCRQTKLFMGRGNLLQNYKLTIFKKYLINKQAPTLHKSHSFYNQGGILGFTLLSSSLALVVSDQISKMLKGNSKFQLNQKILLTCITDECYSKRNNGIHKHSQL